MAKLPDVREPVRADLMLRKADQVSVAVLGAAALVALGAYWFAVGGHRGELIEIDRAAPLRVPFLVDVNSADWAELAELPGVGETLAQRIVQSRQEQGPFVDHQQLLRVIGIGPRTLERIEPYLIPLPAASAMAGGGVAGQASEQGVN